MLALYPSDAGFPYGHRAEVLIRSYKGGLPGLRIRSGIRNRSCVRAVPLNSACCVPSSPGAPFRAESILPAAARRPGTFRYVRRRAAGYDFLCDAFLADYESGATAFVVELEAEASAVGLIDRFLLFLEENGRVQASPAPAGSPWPSSATCAN